MGKTITTHNFAKKTKKLTKGAVSRRIFLICVFTYPIIHFLVFWLYTNISAIALAFVDRAGRWNNFDNFIWVFKNITSSDPRINMTLALKNTLTWWSFGLIVELPLAFICSYFFFKKIMGFKFFRVVLYMPAIISTVVMVGVFIKFVQTGGPLSVIYSKIFGKEMPELIYSSERAMKTMLVYSLWNGYGTAIILFSGGLMRIPEEVLESGRLDGAGLFREAVSIVIPMIWPTITTQVILSVAGMLSASGPVLLFTNGDYNTTTLSFMIFQQYFEFNQIERAATMGLTITCLSLPIVFFSRFLLAKIQQDVEY